MHRLLLTAALLAAVAAAPACRTYQTESSRAAVDGGALVRKDLRSYHLVYSDYQGKVGYVKVFDVVEAGGEPFTWKYVYDLDWNELGFIDQLGTGYAYHHYSEREQSIHKRPFRLKRLPTDSTERNVMRLLGIDPAVDDVTFPDATKADILGG